MTHKFLGIDPGIHGALAFIVIAEDGPRVADAIDLPTIGTKAKERVNVHAVQEWILQHGPFHAFIERGQAMPRHAERRRASSSAASSPPRHGSWAGHSKCGPTAASP